MKSQEELDKELEDANAKVNEESDKSLQRPTFPNPGDGFAVEPHRTGAAEKFPTQATLDAEGNPLPRDERLDNAKAFLEPLGWEADGIRFTAPSDIRTFFVNEFGQAETINFERKYTAKEALRIHDRMELTIKAEEQAMKKAEQQRVADARRAALNRV